MAGTALRVDVSRWRGGTVLFATKEDAERAIEMFDGYRWQTRLLKVVYDYQGLGRNRSLASPGDLTSSVPTVPTNPEDFSGSPPITPTGSTRFLFVGNVSISYISDSIRAKPSHSSHPGTDGKIWRTCSVRQERSLWHMSPLNRMADHEDSGLSSLTAKATRNER